MKNKNTKLKKSK